MTHPMAFDEVLEAADQLSPEEQQSLIAILYRRLAEAGRQRIAAEIQEARQEFAEGRCRPVTHDELMAECGFKEWAEEGEDIYDAEAEAR